jgi:allophanate hydrolase subunit 1
MGSRRSPTPAKPTTCARYCAPRRARPRANIRIHSFAIGPEALAGPIAAVEMASRTGGYFIPVRNPGDLVDIVEEVSFANIEKVTLEQIKTRAEAKPFRITADGSWAGFLALEPGANTIRATAVAEEGATAERRIQVSLVDKPPIRPIPICRSIWSSSATVCSRTAC